MSDVKRALALANRQMGDQMGTKYEVDRALALSNVHLFKTKTEPDEAKLKESLGKLPGYKSSWKYKEGFGVAFEGDRQPGISDVQGAAGIEITDLILGPSRAGVRYFCPMHPHKTAAGGGTCPVCQMKMIEIAASAPTGAAERPAAGPVPQPGGGKYVCSMDGAGRADPGPCPKCGMKLAERDYVPPGGRPPVAEGRKCGSCGAVHVASAG